MLAHARKLRAIAEANYKKDEIDAELLLENGHLVIRRRPAARFPLSPGNAQDTFASGTNRSLRAEDGNVTETSVSRARVHDIRFQRVE